MTSGFVAEEDLFPLLSVLADMVGYDFERDSDWVAIHHAIYSDEATERDRWVEYEFAGKKTAALAFAWDDGSGVVRYRIEADAEIEFAIEWVAHTMHRWTITQDGRPLRRDGTPEEPYGG